MTVATDVWTEERVRVADVGVQVLRAGRGESLLVFPDDVGIAGWQPFHERLAERFSVYLVSAPGFGASERPVWAREIHDLVALQQLVLERLGLVAPRVLGFGFGGWLAAEMAVLCPERFSRMVLVAPFGVKPLAGEIFDQFLVQGSAYVRAGFHDPAAFAAVYGDEPDLDRRELWEINREMVARVAYTPYVFRNQLPYLLPEVKTPALIVWGAEDRIIPPGTGERWASLLPDARLELVPDCGHFVDLEQPEALARAVAAFMA